MFIHSILFVTLAVLSATAVYASSLPITKSPREQQAPRPEKETDDAF